MSTPPDYGFSLLPPFFLAISPRVSEQLVAAVLLEVEAQIHLPGVHHHASHDASEHLCRKSRRNNNKEGTRYLRIHVYAIISCMVVFGRCFLHHHTLPTIRPNTCVETVDEHSNIVLDILRRMRNRRRK